MTFSERAVEAAAKTLRERDMAGRITVPWEKIPKGQKKKWIERGQSALTAALAVEGLVLVPISDLRAVHEIADRNESSIEIERIGECLRQIDVDKLRKCD